MVMVQIDTVRAESWEEWVAESDGILLDIRERREWKLGTLPGALLIPMSELQARIDEIPKDRPILCICRSGARSQQVATFLKFNGYDLVANMVGGMKALGMQK
jgi:phage shock protein E